MTAVETIALTMGVGWAAGINLYAAIFMLGLMQTTGHMALPPDLVVLADPMVMFAAGTMYCVEFFADKVPGVDTSWDTVHTFIRIPAGAVLASQAVGDVSEPMMLAAGLMGGALAAGSHSLKAGSRLVINASPEPVSNWSASLAEDVMVFGGLWAALHYPWAFLAGLALFIAVAIWMLPKIGRAIGRFFAWVTRGFRSEPAGAAGPPIGPEPPAQA